MALVKRFNGPIADAFKTPPVQHQRGALEQALLRYVDLPHSAFSIQHSAFSIQHSAFKSKTPMQTMKGWHRVSPAPVLQAA